MDLKRLRLFMAVAEERNFTRAAERLHMAQPPLTRQIRALEDELGVALFQRTPRGAELTAAGHTLMEDAPKVLALAQRARERAVLAGQGHTGVIEVGTFGSAIIDVIPRILARFHAQRPGVRVVLHHQTKAEQIQALRERRIAVGFNRLVPQEAGLVVEAVLQESLVVAVPSRHRLARRTRLSLHDLADQPMILYPQQGLHGLAQMVRQAFDHEGVALRVEHEVDDVLTGVALVAGGFGLCITTASASRLRPGGVTYRPLDCAALPHLELACIYRNDDSSPILAAFLDAVRDCAQDAASTA